jgi:hypothetical protein
MITPDDGDLPGHADMLTGLYMLISQKFLNEYDISSAILSRGEGDRAI